jgi:NADH-quinone oxidoreductase subunit J
MDLFFFVVFAVVAVGCGISVVLQTHPISSALSLVGVMGALAVLYLLLGAEFIAMAQVIVYAGAIMVLFIFVIMLLNSGGETKAGRSVMVKVLGVPVLACFVVITAWVFSSSFSDAAPVHFGGFSDGTARSVGRAIFGPYLLPFEVTSVLILVAILGAVVLARKELD